MLDGSDVRAMFEETSALREGHFLLRSGRHSGTYVEKFRVLERPELVRSLTGELARRFSSERPGAVVGPAVGGIILSCELAAHLGVRTMFTERVNGVMALRRGFSLCRGERVLVVEDVATTGSSIREVLDVMDAAGAVVVGVGLLVDRSEQGLELAVRTEALLRLPLETHEAQSCPLCAGGVPLEAPGSAGAGPGGS